MFYWEFLYFNTKLTEKNYLDANNYINLTSFKVNCDVSKL